MRCPHLSAIPCLIEKPRRLRKVKRYTSTTPRTLLPTRLVLSYKILFHRKRPITCLLSFSMNASTSPDTSFNFSTGQSKVHRKIGNFYFHSESLRKPPPLTLLAARGYRSWGAMLLILFVKQMISPMLPFKYIRSVDAGCFDRHTPVRHSLEGRMGRGTKLPPQFGQTFASIVSAQLVQ